MGAMYDYFRAPDDDVAKRVGGVLGGPAAARHPGVIETKFVEPFVKVARLRFHVLGQPETHDLSLTTQLLPEVPVGPDNWEEPTLERLSDELRDDLAGVPEEEHAELGRWWAITEEFVLDRADPGYVASLCAQLLTLCRDAREHGEHVYVWSSLTPTRLPSISCERPKPQCCKGNLDAARPGVVRRTAVGTRSAHGLEQHEPARLSRIRTEKTFNRPGVVIVANAVKT